MISLYLVGILYVNEEKFFCAVSSSSFKSLKMFHTTAFEQEKSLTRNQNNALQILDLQF